MSIERGGYNPEQEKSPEGIKPQQEHKVELEKGRVRPIDVRTLGSVTLETPGSGRLSAKHEVVTIRPQEAARVNRKYAELGHKVELTPSGEVYQDEKIVEKYSKEYVQLPDGSVKTAKVEIADAKGDIETLTRSFSTEGRVTSERDELGGKVRGERRYAYDKDGRAVAVEEVRYDDTGKEAYRFESKVEADGTVRYAEIQGEKVTRSGSQSVKEATIEGPFSSTRQNYDGAIPRGFED